VRETVEKGIAQVAMGGVPKRMKINREETKRTKKDQKKLRAIRFFVAGFRRGYASFGTSSQRNQAPRRG
jgi:hypothetical protein